MMTTRTLTPAQRNFLTLVAQAAFANPFSAARRTLDLRLGTRRRAPDEQADAVDEAIARVGDALCALEPLDVREFGEPDRRLVELAVLFDTFYRFADALDDLLVRQLEAGSRLVEVPFAPALLDALGSRGIPGAQAVRILGIFYQLRRAFYFIHFGLIGPSSSMQALRERVWTNIFTSDVERYERLMWNQMEDFSVFLRGESGSGKGQVAAALGRSGWIPFDQASGRFAHSFVDGFVPINLSQFPESLIESELFGHRRGAFTGAIDHAPGVFGRVRRHATVFLDEIGDTSIPIQIKLLRVLQERAFTPVGGQEPHRFEGRIVAATNRPLEQLHAEGRFREDFYYRLCTDVIELPTLRQRLAEHPDELHPLIEHIVERMFGADPASTDPLVAQVLDVIAERLGPDYAWPGNVRELEQCVRRVILTGDYTGSPLTAVAAPSTAPPVQVVVSPPAPAAPAAPAIHEDARDLAAALAAGTIDARDLTIRYCKLLYARHNTYEEVARRTGLDRRTVKKYVDE